MCSSIEMGQSNKDDATMAKLLSEELEALQRQRDQYALAMDAATDPKVAIRLQRTLERIEDEIEGLEESLRALPEPAAGPSEPAAAPPEPPAAASESDWDDEPSTAVYSPSHVREQLASLGVRKKTDTKPAAKSDGRRDFAFAPTLAAREPKRIQPSATIPAKATAPAEKVEAEPDALPKLEQPNPLGPVWMDGLSPPTGVIPNEAVLEARSRTPKPVTPEPGTSQPDMSGDDPFALPTRAIAPETEASSPFGTAVDVPPSLANPVSVLDDDLESNSWGWGAKLALMLVVGLFLAGAFYIMSIG